MGLASGSIAATRYRLLGAERSQSIAALNELLEGHRAAPFKVTGVPQVEYHGWVKPMIALSNEADAEDDYWDMSDGHYDEGFFLRLRVEKRKVPTSVLQLVYKQKLAAEQEQSDKPLARSQKKQIREKVTRDLLGKCLPQITYIDGYWREKAGDLVVFSTGKGALTTFLKAFIGTFGEQLGLHPVAMVPPILGLLTEDWQTAGKLSGYLDKLALTLPVAPAGSPVAH